MEMEEEDENKAESSQEWEEEDKELIKEKISIMGEMKLENGASSLNLVGSKVTHLGPLSREGRHWQRNWQRSLSLQLMEMSLVSCEGNVSL